MQGTGPGKHSQGIGIVYLPSPKVRSDLYLAFLPLLISQRVELLDNSKMLLQFQTLVRETGKSGKDKVNHAVGAHDDSCNAAAGALVLASQAPAALAITMPFVSREPYGVDPGLPPVVIDPQQFENPMSPSRAESIRFSLARFPSPAEVAAKDNP